MVKQSSKPREVIFTVYAGRPTIEKVNLDDDESPLEPGEDGNMIPRIVDTDGS